jgi:formylglycine-generating enzyme required for sulfatase activity
MYRKKILLLLATALANPAAKAQDMIQIPAGPFTMGSNEGRDDERPAHTVTLAAFEIDRLQVTNAEFAMFIDRHGTTDRNGRRYFDWDDNDARIHRVEG